jgi:large subunit ribosomal protein L22
MSAIANAEHNKNLAVDTLFVKEIWCGKALTMKRIMPGPRGSARPILKPFSNLTIVLESGVAPAKKEKTEKTEKTAKKAKAK